jgi:hypothetical protein
MTNEDVMDLFNRVNVGSKVVVLPKNAPAQVRTQRLTPASARPIVPASPSGRQALTSPTATID